MPAPWRPSQLEDEPLLMIPGPTPLSPRVREALARPVLGHATEEVEALLAYSRGALREVAGAPPDADAFVLPGSGTLAMETALINHVAPGEKVLVVNHGYFSRRFTEICSTHGVLAQEVGAPWGQTVPVETVAAALAAMDRVAMVIVTHVDTSTGARADVAPVAAAARERGALVLVDGVCSTAGVEEDLLDRGVDVLVTASQKALSAPPGLAILVTSARAATRRETVPSRGYYMDLARWQAPMTSTAYFATHATSLVRALAVSLEEILEEGLGARFRRHVDVADHARSAFRELGLQPLTSDAALAPTLSVVAVPDGVDEARLRADLRRTGVLVAAGIGEFAGKAIRVGHMGTVGHAEVEQTVAAVSAALAAGR